MEEQQEVEYESGSAASSGHKDKVDDLIMINQQEKEEEGTSSGFGSDEVEVEVEGSGRGRRPWLKLEIGAAATGNHHIRVCRICKKGFSTGKALGGHMRMHAMTNCKNPKEEIGNNKNDNLTSESLVDDGKQNCRVCGRDFPSMKSLFGHMRCHPEREWRGIQPPAPVPMPSSSPSSEYSTLSDDHHPIVDSSAAVTTTRPQSDSDSGSGSGSDSVVDLSSRLSIGWSATAKRGRKRSSAGSGLEPGIERRTEEGIYHLMMLAYANPKPNHLTLTHQSPSYSETAKNITWGEEEQKLEPEQGTPETEITPSPSPESVTAREPLNCGHESSRGMMVMVNNNKRRRVKKLKLTDLEAGGSDNKDQIQNQINKHICSLCSKSFPTHQALGGHRSSHNKSKVIQNVKDTVKSESQNVQLEVNSGHHCNICNKTFSTGQALGGHKRSHWIANAEATEPYATTAQAPAETTQPYAKTARAPAETTQPYAKTAQAPAETTQPYAKSAQASSPAETTSHTETSRVHSPKLLDFDLNELPPMDEEDQEVNAPSASASHNSVTN